jgi:hypothetical protein
MNAIDCPTTAFATSNMTKFRAAPSRQSGESTTILAGPCRNRQSSACARWLQATRRGNLGIIAMIYRTLVFLRRQSSMRSRLILSDLACPRPMARNAGHHLEIPRFHKHNGALVLSHLPETMVKPVGNAPGTDALRMQQAVSTTPSVA